MMTERELFYRYLGLPSFQPMELSIAKAEGIWLTATDGSRYMDLVSGISVSNVGHRHPRVVKSIKTQLDKYLYINVYGEFILSPQVRLAQKLIDLLPPSLESVYFVNSGSEAIEGAIKLAKRFTGREEVVSFYKAYHGSTQGALSILGDERLKRAFRPLIPGTRLLRFNQPEDLDHIGSHTACVVMEVIQAEAGLVLPDPEFLEKLAHRCKTTGALVVVDDVQMGFGRTGSLFSFEPYDLVPDILVLAKALGAGLPLGAFIASRQIMTTLASNPELGHITTFGGHPLSCAAALAGIEVLLEDGLIDQVENKGSIVEQRISSHPAIRAFRRKGLAFGIDLTNPEKRKLFSDSALREGVVIDWYLFQPATFRIAPPLTITGDEITEACNRVLRSLDKIL